MEENQLKAMWQSYHEKVEKSLSLNRKNMEDITKLKVQSFLSSMKPLKIFTIGAGIAWVALVDIILIALVIHAFDQISLFFLVSASLQVLLTKLAIGIYVYQLLLIYQTDVSAPIIAAQVKLARLKTSTLWVTRILLLQLPLWTTFYWSEGMFKTGNIPLLVLQGVITVLFTAAAGWLFINIRYENRNKQWFRRIFSGREWDPILKSMTLLEEIEEFNEAD